MPLTRGLRYKFIEQLADWAGLLGPQRTPAPAAISRVMAEPDQGVWRGRRRPPHFEICGDVLNHDTRGVHSSYRAVTKGSGRPARWVLSALLATQGIAFYAVSRRAEEIPPSRPLAEFPTVIGEWRMVREGVIEQDEKDVLRADDYLTRQYAASPGKSASIFAAYFQSQRAGQTPHSPKNCLPGSGWTWSVADEIRVAIAGRGQPIGINRYIVSKGAERAVVLYWFRSRDRVVASEYRAAAFTAWDALRYNRTDTELVRVVTRGTEDGVEFIQAIFAKLQSR